MKGLQSPHQHCHAGLIVPSTLNVKMPKEPRFFLGRTWMSNRIDRRFRFYSSPQKRELSKPFSNRYQLFNCSQHSIFYVTHSLAQTSIQQRAAKGGSAGISELPRMAFVRFSALDSLEFTSQLTNRWHVPQFKVTYIKDKVLSSRRDCSSFLPHLRRSQNTIKSCPERALRTSPHFL